MKSVYPVLLLLVFLMPPAPGSAAELLPCRPELLRGDTGEVLLKKGTLVTVELIEPVSSDMPQAGSPVSLWVRLNVIVDGKIVINEGRYGEGQATVRRSGLFGRPGRVTVQALNVQTVDGQRIALESLPLVGVGRDRYALAIVGSIILPAVGVILGPAQPWAWWLTASIGFGFLVKGKEVEIPPKSPIRAFVKRDVWVRV